MGTIKKITVDLQRNKYEYVRVSQYDENSRTIIIQITDNGKSYSVDTSSVTPHIKYLKSDGKYVVNDTSEETLTVLEDGTIKLVLSAQMCASYGRNEAELVLIDTDSQEVLHTCHFYVNVDKAVFQDNEVTSKDEFTSFENALLRVEYILDRLQPITESQIDALF